jgi:anti-anti-sigma factor
MSELATITSESRGALLLISLSGEIDLSNAALLEDAAHAMLGSETTVLLDLGDVVYMDSAGLGLIQRLYGRLAESGAELRVVARPGSAADELMRLTGIDVPVDAEPPALPPA